MSRSSTPSPFSPDKTRSSALRSFLSLLSFRLLFSPLLFHPLSPPSEEPTPFFFVLSFSRHPANSPPFFFFAAHVFGLIPVAGNTKASPPFPPFPTIKSLEQRFSDVPFFFPPATSPRDTSSRRLPFPFLHCDFSNHRSQLSPLSPPLLPLFPSCPKKALPPLGNSPPMNFSPPRYGKN